MSPAARAWQNHQDLTKLALQAYEAWDEVAFEPIEQVLSSLSVEGYSMPLTRTELAEQVAIQESAVNWAWRPNSDENKSLGLTVLVWSTAEPNNGMDAGKESRHFFYRNWDWRSPILTFHSEKNTGAVERADLFFKLANQAKARGHLFWAYRFLGWGLHYVQDLGEPYRTTQFVGIQVVALSALLTQGWSRFVVDSKERVSNLLASFEQNVSQRIDALGESELSLAFKVPRANSEMKTAMENNKDLSIVAGARILAAKSSELAVDLAKAQMGNFEEHAQAYRHQTYDAVSNTGVATRWYVDRFR